MVSEPISSAVLLQLERNQEILSREMVSYDVEKVFWRSVYGGGIALSLWAAIKLGVFMTDFQREVKAVLDLPRIKALEIRASQIRAELAKVDPEYDIPWWRSLFVVSSLYNIWDYLNKPSSDEVAVLKDELAEILVELEVLRSKEDVNPFAGYLRAADHWAGLIGPVLPVAVVSYNSITEYMRVEKLRRGLK